MELSVEPATLPDPSRFALRNLLSTTFCIDAKHNTVSPSASQVLRVTVAVPRLKKYIVARYGTHYYQCSRPQRTICVENARFERVQQAILRAKAPFGEAFPTRYSRLQLSAFDVSQDRDVSNSSEMGRSSTRHYVSRHLWTSFPCKIVYAYYGTLPTHQGNRMRQT
jgi:hypothetical protein